jgi:hypothetical protein
MGPLAARGRDEKSRSADAPTDGTCQSKEQMMEEGEEEKEKENVPSAA